MIKNYKNRGFGIRALSVQALVLMLVALACRKTEQYKFSTDLAIDSRTVRVAADAASTRLIVYSDGSWTAKTLQDAPWATLKNSSGKGKGEILVDLEDNSGNLPRGVQILIEAEGKTDTISLQQRGIIPAIAITDATANSIANGGTIRTPISTNVPLNLMDVSYRYVTEGQADWISDVNIQNNYLYFKVAQNQTPAPRVGVLRLSYLDALGTVTRDSITITQNLRVNYDNAVQKDFAYVKQMLSAGAIEEDIYIEGIVVSDKGNPNMAKNLNSASNKHVLDKTENAVAVYVQSLDGTHGLYIKTKTGGDNMLNFNEQVKIWLKGATLEKLANPNRAIIKGIESLHIMSKEERAAPLQPKEKYIKDLTDDDLYTYVKLKGVEISVPFGAFTNINEGYTARLDCYPTNVRDINGNSLYMLTNLGVPYRRDGKNVPQGSGTISGILVSETLERYGSNIGKYAIRPLQREDIALQESRANGFSAVLVEWSRFKTEYNAAPTAAQNPLTPDIGEGRIYRSGKTALNFTSSGIYATTDYNGLLQEPSTNKGAVANGAWGSNSWWNTTANKGEYWGIEVSTAGISSPISLQLEGNSDIGGPRNFVVEWSDHNEDAKPWNTVGTFTFQDVADWANTLLTQLPGHKVVNLQFPQAASGLQKLYIRIRASNRTAGTATTEAGGTINNARSSRLAHVSIKYNK